MHFIVPLPRFAANSIAQRPPAAAKCDGGAAGQAPASGTAPVAACARFLCTTDIHRGVSAPGAQRLPAPVVISVHNLPPSKLPLPPQRPCRLDEAQHIVA